MRPKYIEIYDLVQASPDEYLMHHQIKGAKWGVRRGPPYPLGSGTKTKSKKVVKSRKDRIQEDKKSRRISSGRFKETVTFNQKVSEMSDEELRRLTERLRLENNYKQEYARSNQVSSFYQQHGQVFRDVSAAGDIVAKFGRWGLWFLKTAGKLAI